MEPWLNLNGKIFSNHELEVSDSSAGKTPFEISTLSFCRDWLTGAKEFSLQTSGSTGIPKEIHITRTQMEASAKLTIEALDLKPGMNSLVCLDTRYIAGKMMLVRSFINNMNIVAAEPEANPFGKTKEKIDFAALVPYQVETILSHSKDELDKLQCAIVGGAAVSVNLQKKMQTTPCTLYATYGMTETVSHIALQKLNGKNAADFFTAQPGVHLQLDNRGCLTIQADFLGSNPIVTNDLVEMIAPGSFKWIGRIDNILNSGGVKVSPEKIEKIFERIFSEMNIPNRFFVGGLSNDRFGEEIILVMESSPWPESVQTELLKKAAALSGKYETPKKILFAEKFIETATGKVNRSETIRLLK